MRLTPLRIGFKGRGWVYFSILRYNEVRNLGIELQTWHLLLRAVSTPGILGGLALSSVI